ncbi:MAG: recombinase family protein [Planctomycetes bacterium]|nr:recombinase family protein [Planctomycetota bacterium]
MKPEAPKVWNCALYVRVSTDRQASKEFSSLDTQEDVLRQFVKEKNEREEPSGTKWTIVKVYSEAKSAKDTNRPVFQQMLRDIEAGLVNMIVFIRLDRFSRSLRDFLNLQDFLRDHGCGFISKHDPMLDTSSPHGEFIVRLFLMLAEYERKLTSARVKEKMGWRATQGLWNGGQILGYDLSRNPTGTLVVNEKEAAIIRYLYRTYAETRSLRQTAKLANEKGHRTKSYLSRTNQQHEGVRFNKYTVWQTLINPVYESIRPSSRRPNGMRFDGSCGKRPPDAASVRQSRTTIYSRIWSTAASAAQPSSRSTPRRMEGSTTTTSVARSTTATRTADFRSCRPASLRISSRARSAGWRTIRRS